MDRRKAQKLGYRMLRPENLDLLFEYWEMHGLGLETWRRKRATKRER